jgi:transcriptional regulator with XRE-family HTH domain
MPPVPDDHPAHDYAERIRERLPRRLQEIREAAGFTKYGLARESGVSREYIGKIERGKANPTLPVTAQLSHGLGMTLTQFSEQLEDDDEEE